VTVTTIDLRPRYTISRAICGGWQLAGGHGAVDGTAAVDALVAFAEAGIATFDCADIYTGVEELMGAMRAEYGRRHGAAALAAIKVHTKCVPNLATLAETCRASIGAIVDTSLQRLRTERLDLVQFHWWDYDVPGCLDAAGLLAELQREGKIDRLGGTNFDTPHTAEIVAAGIELTSLQVQYSLLDNRPEHGLVDLCRRQNIHLLVYGTVAGGFLSDHWLGAPEPMPPFENRSLTKYKLIIDDFGGWELFQALLRTLRHIADRRGADIASVASRAILDRPMVAAVIVGARNRNHLARNATLTELPLTAADQAEIDAVLVGRKGPAGDTFELERDRAGKHGSIMKYNLNTVAAA
jgi:aryl-alcohol dehydrogenase-like predicted oxidoreductase